MFELKLGFVLEKKKILWLNTLIYLVNKICVSKLKSTKRMWVVHSKNQQSSQINMFSETLL
jgi:hypothetical protein